MIEYLENIFQKIDLHIQLLSIIDHGFKGLMSLNALTQMITIFDYTYSSFSIAVGF